MGGSLPPMRHADELSAIERVHTGGNPDRVRRRDQIAHSTPSSHGQAHEAALLELCALYHRLHERIVQYLQGGGNPGNQGRSATVRAADGSYNGALRVVAAAFGVLYPDSAGQPTPAITEVEALIRRRLGPLCSGWRTESGLVHHPSKPCDFHNDHEDNNA
jgi:hypothetical protein